MKPPFGCCSRLSLAACILILGLARAVGQDWPQWRGLNRDAKAAAFSAPETWPAELTQVWRLAVGDGVATPALSGGKVYAFTRQGSEEVLRCLDADSGREVWQERYEAQGAAGPAASFAGPRCSPTVGEGKVVTLGVRGALACFGAATGKVLWRKDDFAATGPRFFTSSSPIVADGLCVAQLGGEGGGMVAYALADGAEKWRWTGDGSAYASPVLLAVGGVTYVVAQTDKKVVAIRLTDGTLAWDPPFVVEIGRAHV